MGIPAIQKIKIAGYVANRLSRGQTRFPLVLMLEPLFQCNLRCRGCGKSAYGSEILARRLSVTECIEAAEECGAPVVSIPGGEPLLHPEIHLIARELAARKKFVYLCTNALLVKKRIDEFLPSPFLTFSIHLDGLGEAHDRAVNRRGVFEEAVSAIRLLLDRGFRVTTNTTFFKGMSPDTAARFFDFLTALGVEGLTVAPGFSYEKAAGQDHFLDRLAARDLFREILALAGPGRWRFNHSSLYLAFLAGEMEYPCTPWGNPTRNIFGWQRPCYLLDDDYVHSFDELMETTDWNSFGFGRDPRCTDCLVHCGYEPTAVMDSIRHPLKAWKAARHGNGQAIQNRILSPGTRQNTDEAIFPGKTRGRESSLASEKRKPPLG